MSNLQRTYHVRHRNKLISSLLEKAHKVANYAVKNKMNKKLLSSKYVKQYNLPSSISNQILRKYSSKTIKCAKNINLVIPNQVFNYKLKDGTPVKNYSILFDEQKNSVYIKQLKIYFKWNPGIQFERIVQIEVSKDKFMVTIILKEDLNKKYKCRKNVLGIDLNCGKGRSIANCANLKTGEILNLGKEGPGIKYAYNMKVKNNAKNAKTKKDAKKQQIKSNKTHRRLKDLDHKVSKKIVDYAEKNKLTIVVENLKGIRNNAKKGNGLINLNRLVNSWSYYRLQTYIEYKAKERKIPFIKIDPRYTSKTCSYCHNLGKRDGPDFKCKNRRCKVYGIKRNADINAAFNIGFKAMNN